MSNSIPNKKTVIILGMHRSGTSMTAGIVEQMGVNMGTRFDPIDVYNIGGYYEDLDIREINEKILKQAGGSWYDPPARKEILAVNIKEDLSYYFRNKSGLWGWKDPRTSLTIELFLPFVDNPYFIICYRDREEIVQSIINRDGLNREKILNLIEMYEERIDGFFQRYLDLPKLFVEYQKTQTKPRDTVKEISNFLDITISSKEVDTIANSIYPSYVLRLEKIKFIIKKRLNNLFRFNKKDES